VTYCPAFLCLILSLDVTRLSMINGKGGATENKLV